MRRQAQGLHRAEADAAPQAEAEPGAKAAPLLDSVAEPRTKAAPLLDSVEEAIAAIARGEMVVVVDDEDRENEGDLVMAAEKVTPEAVNFMARHGRGLICLALTAERLRELDIPPLVDHRGAAAASAGGPDGRPGSATGHQGTAFMMSIDAREEVTTGISAADRARTIRLAVDPGARPDDFVRPGHVFPLQAKEGGVLRRPGHTEASVDLARLAGLYPAGVICEIMNDDGTMARLPELRRFADAHGLKLISIADLIAHRKRTEKLVRRVATARLPTEHGEFTLNAFADLVGGDLHVALTMGDVADGRPVLVRVHSECLTGDVLGSRRCDCGEQLERALAMIAGEGRGVLLYMRQEGRGIGLLGKLRAYELQDRGLDTVDANLALGYPPDARDYGLGAQILAELGVRRMRLLTNNPRKYQGLSGYGLEIVERVPLSAPPNPDNARYLETKRTRLGHLF